MSAIEHDRWVLEPLGDGKVRIRHKDWDHLDVEVPVEVLEKGVALVRGSQQELIKGVMETLTTEIHAYRGEAINRAVSAVVGAAVALEKVGLLDAERSELWQAAAREIGSLRKTRMNQVALGDATSRTLDEEDQQAGTQLARRLKLNPHRIVRAFLAALEDANQHDMSRAVEAKWKRLTKGAVCHDPKLDL